MLQSIIESPGSLSVSEAYDSPKKKAPDLYNGVSDDNTPEEIIPQASSPSQTIMYDYVTKINNHPSSNELTNHSVHSEQIPNTFAVTDNSLGEPISSNKLSSTLEGNLNCVDKCIELDKLESVEEPVLRLFNDENSSVVEDNTLSSTENNTSNVQLEIKNSTLCKNVDKNDTSLQEVPTALVPNGLIDTTCDTPNSDINLVHETENSYTKEDFSPAFEQFSKDAPSDNLENEIVPPENSSLSETEEKPKRGISSEIKKFLEHEKDIEYKFTHFESKFRSPPAVLNTELSPDTPPTSPEFEPKLSQSFEDHLDDQYESFDNFSNFKSNQNSEDFGDFKFSEVNNQTAVPPLHKENSIEPTPLPSAVMKLEALSLGEDVISTKDINLEFSEQNICDSSEIVTTQNPCSESTKQDSQQPPLDVEEICFEDKDNSFEPDFSQFETTTIAEPETCSKYLDETCTEGEAKSNTKTVEHESTFQSFDDDDDFGDFNSALEEISVSKPLSIPPAQPIQHVSNEDDDFGDFTSESIDPEDDDEFGDFSCEKFPTSAPPTPSSTNVLPQKKFDISTMNLTDLFEKPAQVSIGIMFS